MLDGNSKILVKLNGCKFEVLVDSSYLFRKQDGFYYFKLISPKYYSVGNKIECFEYVQIPIEPGVAYGLLKTRSQIQ